MTDKRPISKPLAQDDTSPLIEGEDYYLEGGLLVFTEAYHMKRGYCCNSGCRHCPYKAQKSMKSSGDE